MWYKILFTGWMCLFVATGQAEDQSASLMRNLAAKTASYKAYEVLFTASMKGEFSDLPGKIVVSGDRYYVQINDYELFCDGKLLYTYNGNEEEVTLEEPSKNDNSLLSNPARFFKMDEHDFNSSYKGKSTTNGKDVEQVELTPKTADSGYKAIRLHINPTTGLPIEVRYEADGGVPIEIAIRKFTPNQAVDPGMFTFDKKKYKGVEVIDLR